MRILLLGEDASTLGKWMTEIGKGDTVDTVKGPLSREMVEQIKPDIGVSYGYRHIIPKEIINLFPRLVNIHISYLPFNRGAHPNVWCIVDQTPAGVSIHEIDEGIDTGPILAKRLVFVEPFDTAKTLYDKLNAEAVDLFQDIWPGIRLTTEKPPISVMKLGVGNYHEVKDLESLDEIDMGKMYRARDLINQLRARTFTPWPGCYFIEDGKKIQIRIELEEV